MRIIPLILFCLIFIQTASTYKDCDDFVKKLIDSLTNGNFTTLPLPSIMFSGITSNNPGQKFECETKGGAEKYSYFLVDWQNVTLATDTFTGLCVPATCSKADIERGIGMIDLPNPKVYDYPLETTTDGLLIACQIVVGLWLAVLVVWSIVLSCREPDSNQFLKKKNEDEPVNNLEQRVSQVNEDFKLFNFYEGYCRVYKKIKGKSITAPIFFLSTFSILFSTEFSYRQTIAVNEGKSLNWFHSAGGVFFCNVEIAFNVIMFVLGIKLAYAIYKLTSFRQIGRFFFDNLLQKWLILLLTSMTAYIIVSSINDPLSRLWRRNYGENCPAVMWQIWFAFRNIILDCKVCLQWFWVMEADILLTLLAAPFYIIFRTKRVLGYCLLTFLTLCSLIAGYAILSDQSIIYEPYKIFNMSKQFTINYQSTCLTRACPYFLGLLFGLFLIEGLQKIETQSKQLQHSLAKMVRRSKPLQIGLHFLGISVMAAMYCLIIPYLPISDINSEQKGAYLYLTIAPFTFLVGLALFLLPSFWQGESSITVFINTLLGFGMWSSLQKMTMTMLMLGPAIIGLTTYSMQNGIYFDFETIFVYFCGDMIIIYILSLLAVSAFDHQINYVSNWLQFKLFGNQNKYSVLVVQD